MQLRQSSRHKFHRRKFHWDSNGFRGVMRALLTLSVAKSGSRIYRLPSRSPWPMSRASAISITTRFTGSIIWCCKSDSGRCQNLILDILPSMRRVLRRAAPTLRSLPIQTGNRLFKYIRGGPKSRWIRFFRWLGKARYRAIETIAVDLHAPYHASPWAIHVPDTFHITRERNRAMDECLKELAHSRGRTVSC